MGSMAVQVPPDFKSARTGIFRCYDRCPRFVMIFNCIHAAKNVGICSISRSRNLKKMRQVFVRRGDLSPSTVVMIFILMILHHLGQTLRNEIRFLQRVGLVFLQPDHRICGCNKTGGRSGSVCLNRSACLDKWISAFVMLPAGLRGAG